MKATYLANLREAGLEVGEYDSFGEWVKAEGWKDIPPKSRIEGTWRWVDGKKVMWWED
jgi:hypothetical protein